MLRSLARGRVTSKCCSMACLWASSPCYTTTQYIPSVVGRLKKNIFFFLSHAFKVTNQLISTSLAVLFDSICKFIYRFYQYLVLRKSFIFLFTPFLPTHWISSTEHAGSGAVSQGQSSCPANARPWLQSQVNGVDRPQSLYWENDWKLVVLLSRMVRSLEETLEENFQSVEGCSKAPFRRKRIWFRPYPLAPPWHWISFLPEKHFIPSLHTSKVVLTWSFKQKRYSAVFALDSSAWKELWAANKLLQQWKHVSTCQYWQQLSKATSASARKHGM